jgi:hypothetical protein
MIARLTFILSLTLFVSGCADMVLPVSNRISQERTASLVTGKRSLVMSEPLNWFASEDGKKYDIYLPQGTFHLEAEDSDYWYFRAPEKVSVVITKLFSTPDGRSFDGGIFISKKTNPEAYSSGAYLNHEGGRMLLVMYFDFRFTDKEGKQWHYSNE